MEIPDIKKLIDCRSEDVWNKVQEHYKIDLKFHGDDRYTCSYEHDGNEVTIYVTENNYNPNYFAHEVFHLYIRLQGSDIGKLLIANFRANKLLWKIFNESLIHQITNSLEHSKMLPIYVEHGFDENQFIVDYGLPLADHFDIFKITIDLPDNSIASQNAAGEFIAIFYSMKAASNSKIDYTDLFDSLKTIDETLYKILDDFWIEWVNYDVTKDSHKLESLVGGFLASLGNWIKRKYVN
jgi:hypothetical protein